MHNTPYNQGVRARQIKSPINSNPYPIDSTDYKEWWEGWFWVYDHEDDYY